LGIAVTPAPVGPLTDLTGWRAFVHRAISPPVLLPAERWSGLDTEARSVDVQDRIGYHAELLALQTPDLHRIVATGRSLLVLNHRQHGARRGLLVSGAPHHREVHRDHPAGAGGGTGFPPHPASAR
jgi:hypothetical protein